MKRENQVANRIGEGNGPFEVGLIDDCRKLAIITFENGNQRLFNFVQLKPYQAPTKELETFILEIEKSAI